MADPALILCDVNQEYVKHKELKKEDVQKLLEWVYLQPHLPKMTEMQVIHFLHSNYFSAEAAKKCIDCFYTVRKHCPEFFANRDPRVIPLDILLYTALPKLTPEGYRVIYARLIDVNPDRYNFSVQVKRLDMATMLMLNKEGTSEGQIVVHDLNGLTFTHLTKLNPLLLKKFFFYLQDCMPVRIKGLHFINIGNFMDKILMLIKPFMKKELVDVLHSHPTYDTLKNFFPADIMPSDLPGGSAPCFEDLVKNNQKEMLNNAPFFCAEELQVADESRRPGKPKDAGEVFGVEGTFKKLDID